MAKRPPPQKPPGKPPRILRRWQVLERLGVSPTTLWRMQRRGDFPPFFQISAGLVGWLEADVDHWIEERARGRA